MEDGRIIALYWARSERAIQESERKYGAYCLRIAHNILQSREDSEECVNDTWLRSWETMPPHKPGKLVAFFGTITRNLALNRYEHQRAAKRGGGQIALALDELMDCVPSADDTAKVIDDMALTQLLNRFLSQLSPDARIIFLRRYWYLCSIKEIARMGRVGESKVKMTLHRSREKLRLMLEEEGVSL